jgi:hypothetical protein
MTPSRSLGPRTLHRLPLAQLDDPVATERAAGLTMIMTQQRKHRHRSTHITSAMTVGAGGLMVINEWAMVEETPCGTAHRSGGVLGTIMGKR